MVATISAIGSSAQASSYYEADDYYADGGLSPSEWQGESANDLGLAGEVERDAFRDMLDGKLPDGQQLGTTRDGKLEHRPGWDVTMSAPKSVSIMAEVAGDRRLIGAHDRAVKVALAIAKAYAALDANARSRTLVIEPSREGRDALTAQIRIELAKAGALSGPAIATQSLVNKGPSRAEARDPASYERGDMIRFTRDYTDKGVSRSEAYRIDRIDPIKAAITLKAEDGRDIDWRLRQWGAGNSQAFSAQPLELKAGDRIQFTRNDRELGRINGGRGTVTIIDEQSRTATIRNPSGQTQTLNLDTARDQHIRHAYVETAFAAQGRTADHVMIHADSKATNLVDQKSFYVSLSRTRETVAIYTNDRDKLVSAINERAGLSQTAASEVAMVTPAAGKSLGAGLG